MIESMYFDLPASLRIVALALMALLCLTLLAASICRVNALQAGKQHKFAWALCYICYAASAAAVLIALLAEGKPPSDFKGFAIVGMCLNIWLTRPSWPGGKPPKIMEKQA